MKKIINTILLLLVANFLIAQEISIKIEDYNKLIKEQSILNSKIDSLNAAYIQIKKLLEERNIELTNEKTELTNEKTDLNNQITELRSKNTKLIKDNSALKNSESTTEKLKAENTTLQEEMNILKAENAELNTKVGKKNIDNLEKQLEEKKNIIAGLNKQIIDKRTEIISIKNESKDNENRKYEEGRQKIKENLIVFYTSNSFDELILSTSKDIIQRDISIIGDNKDALQKLINIKDYFEAIEVLNKKLNPQAVEKSKSLIKKIKENSKALNNIQTQINLYDLVNEGLKSTIEEIIELDRKMIANNSDIQKVKFEKISSVIFGFIRDYEINFKDYPYINEILVELINKKYLNANTEVSYLLQKL